MTTSQSLPANDSNHAPSFLFDFDGTLIDSVYQHVLAWHEALLKAGIELSVWRIHRRIGMSGGLLVNALSRAICYGTWMNSGSEEKTEYILRAEFN